MRPLPAVEQLPRQPKACPTSDEPRRLAAVSLLGRCLTTTVVRGSRDSGGHEILSDGRSFDAHPFVYAEYTRVLADRLIRRERLAIWYAARIALIYVKRPPRFFSSPQARTVRLICPGAQGCNGATTPMETALVFFLFIGVLLIYLLAPKSEGPHR